MSALEHELVERISRLSADQQREVLEFVQHLETRIYSARELMKLPLEERQRYIQTAFDLAADEDFETFEA